MASVDSLRRLMLATQRLCRFWSKLISAGVSDTQTKDQAVTYTPRPRLFDKRDKEHGHL